MALCALVFKVKSRLADSLIPKGLKRDALSLLKVNKTYAANISGVGIVGFDIDVKEEEFAHIVNVIKILEKKYNLALFEFSEKSDLENQSTVSVKVDKNPVLNVA